MNKVILMGRLTRDPEIYYSKSETPIAVAKYALAVRKPFSKDSEDNVDFINMVAFGNVAEFAEKHLKKGQMITILGRLQQDKWEDEQHIKHSKLEVIVERHYFSDSKSRHSEEDEIQEAEHQIAIAESDLPF